MSICDGAHEEFDRIANGAIQVGTLPGWSRVHGRVAWWIARGPLSELGTAWQEFHRRVGEARPGTPNGPPGEIFVCRPEDHASDGQRSLLTLLYLPIE